MYTRRRHQLRRLLHRRSVHDAQRRHREAGNRDELRALAHSVIR